MLFQREIEEVIDKPNVENRLLKYAKRYEEKRMKLKETIYQDMMQDRPFITNSSKKQNSNVITRLYESPHINQNVGQIEKIVKKSSVRYPLNEIVRPISSQNPYNNNTLNKSPIKTQQTIINQSCKFLENTFSQSQKIKPIRQSSYSKFTNNNSIYKQSQSNSIIQLSMDLFQRKKRSQQIC